MNLREEVTGHVAELVEVIGMSGASELEFGWLPDDPDDDTGPYATWWARAVMGPGDRVTAEMRSDKTTIQGPDRKYTLADAIAEGLPQLEFHILACRGALMELHHEIIRRSPREELQVHPWKFPGGRREGIAVARRYLAEAGTPGKRIVVHKGRGGPSVLKHRDGTCWCQPEILQPEAR